MNKVNNDFFDNLFKKIVNFYYNLLSYGADSFKNCGEMSITQEEHKANMVFVKNIGSAYTDCFKY